MSSQSLQSAAVTGHAALIYKCVEDWEQALVVKYKLSQLGRKYSKNEKLCTLETALACDFADSSC